MKTQQLQAEVASRVETEGADVTEAKTFETVTTSLVIDENGIAQVAMNVGHFSVAAHHGIACVVVSLQSNMVFMVSRDSLSEKEWFVHGYTAWQSVLTDENASGDFWLFHLGSSVASSFRWPNVVSFVRDLRRCFHDTVVAFVDKGKPDAFRAIVIDNMTQRVKSGSLPVMFQRSIGLVLRCSTNTSGAFTVGNGRRVGDH